MSKKIILPDSVNAARFQRVDGWVSSDGRFYGKDEEAARWRGATHVRCRICGAPTLKHWTACRKCRLDMALEKYLKFPKTRWDEEVPVYSPVTQKYYWSKEEVREENYKGIYDPLRMQLVLCKPIYASGIDPEEYYRDSLPDEDGELNQVLVDAFQELNDLIDDAKIILSYEPTNVAVA